MLGDIKYQPVVVTVNAAEDQVTIEADTDKQYSRCTGIFVSVADTSVISSTFSRMELGGKELFPDGYEMRMLYATEDVPIDERYYELDEPAKGARLKTKFNDDGNGSYPYTFVIYLRLQNK